MQLKEDNWTMWMARQSWLMMLTRLPRVTWAMLGSHDYANDEVQVWGAVWAVGSVLAVAVDVCWHSSIDKSAAVLR